MSAPVRGRAGASTARRSRGTSRGNASTNSRGRGGKRTVPSDETRATGSISKPRTSTEGSGDGLLQKMRTGTLKRGTGNNAGAATNGRGRGSASIRGHADSTRGRGSLTRVFNNASPTSRPQPVAPRKIASPSPFTLSTNDYQNQMMEVFGTLKTRREAERKKAIQDGFLADPESRTSLDKAITPVGTCTEMCPEFERIERIVQKMVDPAERVVNEATGNTVPSEERMIKRFRRSAAGYDEQLPSDIRTPETLKSTLDYLLDRVIGGGERLASIHKFVWDRTRGIRNDFSIQQVTERKDVEIAIECFERITRFHILSLHQLSNPANLQDGEHFDAHQEREQLNNTLLSLMYYYDDNRRLIPLPNEPEFRAYSILFELQSLHPDLEDRVQAWPRELLDHPRVQTALKVYAAAGNTIIDQGPLRPMAPFFLAQANSGKFWTILSSQQVSYLMACVAEINFGQIRFIALDALWQSGKGAPQKQQSRNQDWTLAELTNYLAFDEDDQTLEFCDNFGLSFRDGDSGEQYLDFTALPSISLDPSSIPSQQIFSYGIVEEKRYRRTLPAVINGISVAAAIRDNLVVEPDTQTSVIPIEEAQLSEPESPPAWQANTSQSVWPPSFQMSTLQPVTPSIWQASQSQPAWPPSFQTSFTPPEPPQPPPQQISVPQPQWPPAWQVSVSQPETSSSSEAKAPQPESPPKLQVNASQPAFSSTWQVNLPKPELPPVLQASDQQPEPLPIQQTSMLQSQLPSIQQTSILQPKWSPSPQVSTPSPELPSIPQQSISRSVSPTTLPVDIPQSETLSTIALQASPPQPVLPPTSRTSTPQPDPQVEKEKLAREAARLVLVQPQGLLEYFIGNRVSSILQDVIEEHAAAEQDRIMTIVRTRHLSRKFFGLWKHFVDKRSLARRAKQRRKLLATAMQAEQDKKQRNEQELEAIVAATQETKVLQAEQRRLRQDSSRQRDRKDLNSDEKLRTDDEQAVGKKRKPSSQVESPARNSNTPRNSIKSHKRSRTIGSTAGLSASIKVPSIVTAFHASTSNSSGISRFSQSLLGRSTNSPDPHHSLSTQRVDSTQTDYFKLKAMGIDPDTPLVPDTARSLAIRRTKQEEARQAALLRIRSRRSGLSPSSVPAARDSITKSTSPDLIHKSEQKAMTQSRPIQTKEVVAEEDDFLKQLREAREAITQDADWFKTQAAELEKELEQHEHDMKLKQQSQSSFASTDYLQTSVNGLARSNGFEYYPTASKSGHSLSRTEQRIRSTGAHGLATRQPGSQSDYLPVAMSKQSAMRYSYGIDQPETSQKVAGRKRTIDDDHLIMDDEDITTKPSTKIQRLHPEQRSKVGERKAIVSKSWNNSYAALDENNFQDDGEDELEEDEEDLQNGTDGDIEDDYDEDGEDEDEDEDLLEDDGESDQEDDNNINNNNRNFHTRRYPNKFTRGEEYLYDDDEEEEGDEEDEEDEENEEDGEEEDDDDNDDYRHINNITKQTPSSSSSAGISRATSISAVGSQNGPGASLDDALVLSD